MNTLKNYYLKNPVKIKQYLLSILTVKFISLFLISSLIGCTTSVERPDIKNTEVINAPYDRVWSALVATISERGYQIDVIEKESGILNTKTVSLDAGIGGDVDIDDIAVRPSVMLGIWNRVNYSYSIHVTETGDNMSRVQINTYIEAYERNMTEEWHRCYSRGILENRIFESIREKI